MISMAGDRSHWSITEVAKMQLASRAKHVFVETVGGASQTYEEFIGASSSLAKLLQGISICHKDVVASLLPSDLPALHAWMGIALAGAVELPLNYHSTPAMIAHALKLAEVKVVICDAASASTLLMAVEEHAIQLTDVVLVGTLEAKLEATFSRIALHSYDEATSTLSPLPEWSAAPHEIASIMLTSGTSGPSKGVLIPHAQACLIALCCVEATRMSAEDVFYCVHPLNHIAGKFMGVLSTFISGGKLVLAHRFDAECWIENLHRYGVTISIAHGPMIEMIAARSETDFDRTHKMRRMMCSPMPKNLTEAFESRFGVRRVEMWGMTETGCNTWTNLDAPHPKGSAGKVLIDLFEIQIADPQTDLPLPAGEVGEIQVRSRHPYTMMQGYIGMPKETMDAWRNLWFHTGDAGYFDADGNLYFVERLKDRIRSRSENISSYDIEVAALAVPGVSDAAAVGVPSGYEGDDDIKLFVVHNGQEELTPTDLLKALARKLPHFMLPRYIEFVDHLPRTPTAKVMKKALREMGNHNDTWDRKADGLRLRDLYE